MSELKVVLNGGTSTKSVSAGYRFRLRPVTPFIGVIRHDNGTIERGVGAKCPDQEKRFFCTFDSNDPLHYWRTVQLLQRFWQIDDSIIRDAVMVAGGTGVVADIALTNAPLRGKDWVRCFEEAQKEAFSKAPDKKVLTAILSEFSKHGAPPKPFLLSRKPEVVLAPYTKLSPALVGDVYEGLSVAHAQAG